MQMQNEFSNAVRRWAFLVEAVGPFAPTGELQSLLKKMPKGGERHPAAVALRTTINDREFHRWLIDMNVDLHAPTGVEI
ncbi:MAG: hypothetical protein P4M02_04735 [Clostridia bacterium]|nr:hypothetical protein [Clostridia bacterium]